MESTGPYHHPAPARPRPPSDPLVAAYRALLAGGELARDTRYTDISVVGRGGQGVVLRARQDGADGFSLTVALKVFSPDGYRSAADYEEDMGRVAEVAARVAAVQHENLVAVHDFADHGGVRVMQMEWVDGYDLARLLTPATLARTRDALPADHARYVGEVVLADGPAQSRVRPGVAVHLVRECLAALAALHREGIAHGDVKPSNLMVKRTGAAKLVDIGSAADVRAAGGRLVWSPLYAAPEVMRGGPATPQTDLASLGYVLVEMLAGRPAFAGAEGYGALLAAKLSLADRLPEVLPADVAGSELLVGLCRRLVAADPAHRFPDARAADLGRRGAAAFHRQLVLGDLASEYGEDLRAWLEALGPPGDEKPV